MNKKSTKKRESKKREKTPEQPENEPEHPTREDDPGAWSDHDQDQILQGRMP